MVAHLTPVAEADFPTLVAQIAEATALAMVQTVVHLTHHQEEDFPISAAQAVIALTVLAVTEAHPQAQARLIASAILLTKLKEKRSEFAPFFNLQARN